MTFMDLQWLTPDIQICSCNLRIACLLTIEFLFVVSGMSCPVDFIRRSDGSCCKPIQCLENQGYNLCSSLYPTGKDSCYNCSIGSFNDIPVNTADITYSYQEELCRKFDCGCKPEAELLNRDECIRTGKRECACKRQDLRYGDDPQACEGPVNDSNRLKSIRRPGFELKNTGNVGECDQGHFKNKSDDSICIPHSQCPKGFFAIFNGSKTEDRQCQQVTTITPSTKTAVKSVTTGLSRKDLTSLEKEQRKNTAEKHFSNPTVEENKHMKPSFPVGNNISDHSEPSKTKSESDGQILFIALGIVIGVLVIILVLAVIICCLHRKKKKDLHKKDSENSDTAHATSDEKRNPEEMNPLLLTITHETQKEIDNNIEKEEKIPKKEDHLGQYTQLLENSCSQSSLVSGSFSKEKLQEDYVLQTEWCNDGTSTTEEIPLVHVAMKECPMVREKVKEKIQRTDSTDVIPRVGACCSRPTDFIPESGEQQFPYSLPNPIILPTHSMPEPHSTDSLDSNGAYSKLNFNSFGMENPLMGSSVSCQRDSDYETGSSRKNESGNSESFSSFGKGLNSLNVNSFDDSSQLSTETQSSVRTGKSVAVVLPFRGMETVDEEETSSKTP